MAAWAPQALDALLAWPGLLLGLRTLKCCALSSLSLWSRVLMNAFWICSGLSALGWQGCSGTVSNDGLASLTVSLMSVSITKLSAWRVQGPFLPVLHRIPRAQHTTWHVVGAPKLFVD